MRPADPACPGRPGAELASLRLWFHAAASILRHSPPDVLPSPSDLLFLKNHNVFPLPTAPVSLKQHGAGAGAFGPVHLPTPPLDHRPQSSPPAARWPSGLPHLERAGGPAQTLSPWSWDPGAKRSLHVAEMEAMF
uniref:Uncharacterized protein n=1 Tax=Molossus molossus TaxID=27622 RepID=A0A7J8JVE1_MOLMO|nr:hypothetical protein HJG59_007866 [Molossus molossus]